MIGGRNRDCKLPTLDQPGQDSLLTSYYRTRASFGGGNGDLMSDLRAHEEWSSLRKSKPTSGLRKWCDEKLLSFNTLNDISSNKAQYISSLQEIGLLPFDYNE